MNTIIHEHKASLEMNIYKSHVFHPSNSCLFHFIQNVTDITENHLKQRNVIYMWMRWGGLISCFIE